MMEVKRIDPKLYKAIMMAYQYQLSCELTPSQCKELVDYIDSPLQVEEECVWKKTLNIRGEYLELMYKDLHPHTEMILCMTEK